MTDTFPQRSTGKWTFHLQAAQALQFHITSEQATRQIVIEGHDISTLLDFLYENRELIYEATHDQHGHHLEAEGDQDAGTSTTPHFKPVRYFDDGEQRTKAHF